MKYPLREPSGAVLTQGVFQWVDDEALGGRSVSARHQCLLLEDDALITKCFPPHESLVLFPKEIDELCYMGEEVARIVEVDDDLSGLGVVLDGHEEVWTSTIGSVDESAYAITDFILGHRDGDASQIWSDDFAL